MQYFLNALENKESLWVCPSKQTSRDQIEKPATKQDVQTIDFWDFFLRFCEILRLEEPIGSTSSGSVDHIKRDIWIILTLISPLLGIEQSTTGGNRCLAEELNCWDDNEDGEGSYTCTRPTQIRSWHGIGYEIARSLGTTDCYVE